MPTGTKPGQVLLTKFFSPRSPYSWLLELVCSDVWMPSCQLGQNRDKTGITKFSPRFWFTSIFILPYYSRRTMRRKRKFDGKTPHTQTDPVTDAACERYDDDTTIRRYDAAIRRYDDTILFWWNPENRSFFGEHSQVSGSADENCNSGSVRRPYSPLYGSKIRYAGSVDQSWSLNPRL